MLSQLGVSGGTLGRQFDIFVPVYFLCRFLDDLERGSAAEAWFSGGGGGFAAEPRKGVVTII